MTVFKILFRKEVNRSNLGERDVQALVHSLEQHKTHAGTVREAANAVLNMCYEKGNVLHVVGTNCVDILIDGLAAGNPASVQASCSGALQSISYVRVQRGGSHVPRPLFARSALWAWGRCACEAVARKCAAFLSVCPPPVCASSVSVRASSVSLSAHHTLCCDTASAHPTTPLLVARRVRCARFVAATGSAGGRLAVLLLLCPFVRGSYQSVGRQHVQERGGVVATLPLLWSQDDQVRARAAGVIHNLSSHPSCVAEIRANAGVTALLTLLREGDSKVISAAAGAVQNLAREAASRLEILSFPNSVRLLGALLFQSDPQCQAFAVGALLNLFTPNLEVRACVRACVCACVRACVRACGRACVRAAFVRARACACVHVCVHHCCCCCSSSCFCLCRT